MHELDGAALDVARRRNSGRPAIASVHIGRSRLPPEDHMVGDFRNHGDFRTVRDRIVAFTPRHSAATRAPTHLSKRFDGLSKGQ